MDEILSAGALGEIDVSAVSPELDELAARLGAIERVLSHRDYHGNNLFIQDGRIRVIDFQDALLAPAAQDIAVLLTTRDTDRIIDPKAERRLLDYYLAGLVRRGVACPDAGTFIDGYYMCVLQHAIKVIGRFSSFERHGKSGYAGFIPHAASQARRALAALSPSGVFPKMRAAFAGS
jgi:N-acetylmuramate 1-kinase